MIVLWIASVLAGAAWGSLSVYPPHEAAHEAKASYSAEQSAANSEPKESFWSPSTWAAITVFTAWVAFFSCLLAVANVGLWIVTYCALRHSRRTAETQLCAYLSVRDTKVSGVPQQAGPAQITVRFRIENYGQTPAYEIAIAATIFVDDRNNPPLYAVGGIVPHPESDIGPRSYQSETVTPKALMPEHEIASVLNGEKALFIQGNITYVDAFGHKWMLRFERIWGTHLKLGKHMAIGPHGDKATRQS